MNTTKEYAEEQSRRGFMKAFGTSMAGLSLSGIFSGEKVFGAVPASTLYMYGGPSQMDLFDYKPELQKNDGKEVNMEIRRGDVRKSKLLASKRKFTQHGDSGLWCSDALPNVAKHMDKLAVIKSLYMAFKRS